jgi:hypothetical protein
MSLAQVLDHLRMGDVIIVRDREASLRLRLPTIPGRPAVVEANSIDSRKLLRSLIAARKDGGDKK